VGAVDTVRVPVRSARPDHECGDTVNAVSVVNATSTATQLARPSGMTNRKVPGSGVTDLGFRTGSIPVSWKMYVPWGSGVCDEEVGVVQGADEGTTGTTTAKR